MEARAEKDEDGVAGEGTGVRQGGTVERKEGNREKGRDRQLSR